MALLVTPWVIFFISHSFQLKKLLWNLTRIFRSVTYSYLWILVILGFATKASYLEEKYWTSVDHLGSRSGHFPTKLGAMTFEVIKEETTELLSPGKRP